MNNEIVIGNHQQLVEMFQTRRTALEQVMPRRSHLTFERVLKIVIAATMRNQQLLQCTRESLWLAVQHAVELGLEPGSPLGHAYLVPFRNAKTGATDCTLIVGYQGLIQLIMRSGAVQSVRADVVFERDQYEVELGSNPKLVHKPDLECLDRGAPKFAYSVANIVGMGSNFIIASRSEIEKRMRLSKSGFDRARDTAAGIWAEWQEEMWRKTALRMHAKWLPMSAEIMARLVATELDPITGEIVAATADAMIHTLPTNDVSLPSATDTNSESPSERTLRRVRMKHAASEDTPEPIAAEPTAEGSLNLDQEV